MEAEILKINNCINGKWPALIQHFPSQHSHTDTHIHTLVTVTTLQGATCKKHPQMHPNTDGVVSQDKLGFYMLSKDTSDIETGGGLNPWPPKLDVYHLIHDDQQSVSKP